MREKTIKDCKRILARLRTLREDQKEILYRDDVRSSADSIDVVIDLKDALTCAIEVYEDLLPTLENLNDQKF